MINPSNAKICRRIAQIRTQLAGVRGKSAFAKQLGISASTYDYYEADRVPPADILVKMADLAKVDLRWLLTGQASAAPAVTSGHPAIQRAAALLAEKPNSAAPLAAFLDILAESMKFPTAKDAAKTPAVAAAATTAAATTIAAPTGVAAITVASASGNDLIPILGRSAAGMVQFWAEGETLAGLTTLADLITRQGAGTIARPATAARDNVPLDDAVAIVSLREPDEKDVTEYISAAKLKAAHPNAFAVRIDGESMSPDILHGDLAVLSPSVIARDGRPAVVQLEGQIGVTCKLYRRVGGMVHLVPINERIPPIAVPAGQVVWALGVLAIIRG